VAAPTLRPPRPAADPLPRAEAAAAVLPPLLLRAERVAATVAQGLHGRRRVGPGDSFWQFRRYQAGDPTQSIDWRQTAKGAHPYVREREWAAAQTMALWCAGDAGMDWRSAPALPSKLERAQVLTLALAILLLDGGERVGLLDPVRPPALGRSGLPAMAQALARRDPAVTAALPPGTAAPARSTVVLIGDFLDPAATWAPVLRGMAERRLRGHLLQVLDPAEESLPYRGRIRFVGAGNRDHWMVRRAEDVRDAYVARLAAHRAALRGLARSLGWTFALHHTDSPPQAALLSLHGVLAGSRPGGAAGWP
jgi:uncharacterized protein (DUF58 family)